LLERLDRLPGRQGEDAQLVGVGSRSRNITLHYDRVGRLVERETHTAS
jgi:hypothetical protein